MTCQVAVRVVRRWVLPGEAALIFVAGMADIEELITRFQEVPS
jgi:hypothetical protein